MSRYNHFANRKYKEILFKDVPIGCKFRHDKRGRRYLVMIKIDPVTYQEAKSKKQHKVLCDPSDYMVSHYSEPFEQEDKQ